jgi:hypothetical protein
MRKAPAAPDLEFLLTNKGLSRYSWWPIPAVPARRAIPLLLSDELLIVFFVLALVPLLSLIVGLIHIRQLPGSAAGRKKKRRFRYAR